jgi:uncharacterized protein (TIGR02301 family)
MQTWSVRTLKRIAAAIAIGCLVLPSAVMAGEQKPYDAKLFRLAEILGAVHYLRELCGASEGQAWRDGMKSLLASEGTSALRRVQLTASFNKGYRSYRRTYQSCTPTAETAVKRFLGEGAEIADGLAAAKP